MDEDRLYLRLYLTTVAGLATLGIIALLKDSVFFADAFASIVVLTIVYFYRRHLLYSFSGAALCCTGWLMNMSGTLGAYEWYFAGLGWDKLLHLVSIIGITLLAHAYLNRNWILHPVQSMFLVFLIAQGFGAVNEIVEFIGSNFFGVGQGMFGMMNGLSEPASNLDVHDTHWDLIINTGGILIGLASIALAGEWETQKAMRRARTATQRQNRVKSGADL